MSASTAGNGRSGILTALRTALGKTRASEFRFGIVTTSEIPDDLPVRV
jgi:hypothetical protein